MILGMVIVILGLVALIVALSFTAVAGSDGKLQGQTNGKIVDISYYPEGFNKGLGTEEAVDPSYPTNRQQHIAATVYAYVVDGVEYRRATNYLINEGVAKKKIGQECQVRYNVNHPAEASIAKRGVYKTIATVLYVVAVVLSVIGLIVIVIM